MTETIICTNNDIPSNLDFSGIHYFRRNHHQKNVFIIVVGGEKKVTRWYQTYDGDNVAEEETIREVVGVVSLQQSPYDENIVWLNFIEVHPEHQNKGISKEMCKDVADVMFGVFHNKILQRSRVSAFCPTHMTEKFDQWYEELGVTWCQERDGEIVSNKK